MKQGILALVVLVTGLFMSAARSEVVVLVHGFLGDAYSWDNSGVTTVLERNGWRRAGVFVSDPAGDRLLAAAGAPQGSRVFYAVDLPSAAPVIIQSFRLQQILHAIKAMHPGEAVSLVGHSAGGIVARVALVRGGHDQVRRLITIASPHLGTGRAEQALDATDIPFPFSIVTDILGGPAYDTVMRSRGLLVDLVPQRPGSLLYWLNSQPHPDIEYFSVVRGEPAVLTGDYIVPGFSQDMNNVPALRGRSSLVRVNHKEHGLTPLDGNVIVSVLAGTI